MSDKPGSAPGDKDPGLLSRFFKAVGLGRGKPASPALGEPGNKVGPKGGHRGMAFGRVGTGREDVSPENRARWEKLRDTEAGDFVYNGSVLYVHSSNVQAAQYDIATGRMVVSFLAKGKSPASVYQYLGVTEDEAISFAEAQSKGSWVWSFMRVRGSATGTKKDYTKIG